jgi:hypothetical protein
VIALSSQVIAMNIADTTASAMRRRKRSSRVSGWMGWVALVAACCLVLEAFAR